MIVGRMLGWLLFLAGLVLIGRDLLGWLDTRRLEPLSFRGLWHDLDPGGLAALQHRVPELLWNVLTPFLALWAWPVLLILGFVLVALCRPRFPARRRR
jgi:hypothetical protein